MSVILWIIHIWQKYICCMQIVYMNQMSLSLLLQHIRHLSSQLSSYIALSHDRHSKQPQLIFQHPPNFIQFTHPITFSISGASSKESLIYILLPSPQTGAFDSMFISFHLLWLRHLGQLIDLSYITPLQKVGLVYFSQFLHFKCNFTLMGGSAV